MQKLGVLFSARKQTYEIFQLVGLALRKHKQSLKNGLSELISNLFHSWKQSLNFPSKLKKKKMKLFAFKESMKFLDILRNYQLFKIRISGKLDFCSFVYKNN